MMAGDVDRGLAKLEEAAKAAPNNSDYQRSYERERDLVVVKYVAEGDILRATLRYDRAAIAYRNALKLDRSNKPAQAGLAALEKARAQSSLVSEAQAEIAAGELASAEEKLRAVLAANPDQRDARAVMSELSQRRNEQRAAAAAAAPPALSSPFTKPITLEFRDASLKSVFEVVSRASGINFVFDRDVRADTKINIFVRDTSLDDVVKLILITNQLERKLLNENSVLIYPDTPAKRKEYQELVMRSFYLANADVKQALNMVKGMVKTPDVFVDEKLNLLVVKDTPEAMRVIDRLVRALDLAEPEVMLEVEVLELGQGTIQQLGIKYPETINIGKVPGAGGAAGDLAFVLGEDDVKGFVLNPPLVVDLKAQDGDVKVLANPRIRVKNREKAKVHIGDRLPVVTTTSTANVGVSSSVSYLDVGLKLDVEPNIYLRDEVAIKVGLEVSNVRNTLRIEQTLAYEIGTRTTATVLQLKDGETQLFSGLISDEDRRTADKVPGLGDLPVLGRLFSTQNDTRRKTEIVLLITPRIVRTLNWNQTALIDVPVGTDAAIGVAPLRISQTGPGTLALAPGAGGPAGRPGVPLPRPPLPPPAGQPQAGVPGVPSPVPQSEEPPVPGDQTALAAPPGAGAAPIGSLLLAAPLAARSGAEVLVSLALAPGSIAQRATAELVYDPLQLEPVGAPASSAGRIPLQVEGSAALRFRILASAGRVQVRIENAAGLDSGGNSVPLNVPGPVDITITP
jgi:general secretion pathway protein D